MQGFGAATVSKVTEYHGFIHCIQTVWTVEGPKAMYKGYSVAIMKSCATSGLVFVTYEFFRDVIERQKNQ